MPDWTNLIFTFPKGWPFWIFILRDRHLFDRELWTRYITLLSVAKESMFKLYAAYFLGFLQRLLAVSFRKYGLLFAPSLNIRGCQIGMQGPQLCAKPRHFCKLDVATSRMAFLDLNLHVLQVAISNSNNWARSVVRNCTSDTP